MKTTNVLKAHADESYRLSSGWKLPILGPQLTHTEPKTGASTHAGMDHQLILIDDALPRRHSFCLLTVHCLATEAEGVAFALEAGIEDPGHGHGGFRIDGEHI